jgi:putative DNA primase/helicase
MPIRGCSTPRAAWSICAPAGCARTTGADRMTKITTATPQGDCPTWRQFLDDVTGGDAEPAGLPAADGRLRLTGVDQRARAVLPVRHRRERQVGVRQHAGHHPGRLRGQRADGHVHGNAHRPASDRSWRACAARALWRPSKPSRAALGESKVKNLTGGDKISARFMRQDFFEFFPQFKLVVAGNHKPAIRNIDEAMKRRLHLIPFTITVPPERRDKHLQQKLLAERDGILAWAVQGCCLATPRRLDPPQQVVDATEEYFEAEDALGVAR